MGAAIVADLCAQDVLVRRFVRIVRIFMALLLNLDGTHQGVFPKNGQKFGLHEVQDILFGNLKEEQRRMLLIEQVPTYDGRFMLVDEEARMRNLAPNRKATLMLGPPHVGEQVLGPALVVFHDEWE